MSLKLCVARHVTKVAVATPQVKVLYVGSSVCGTLADLVDAPPLARICTGAEVHMCSDSH